MSVSIGQLFKVPAALLESGLLAAQAIIDTAQRGIQTVAGQPRTPDSVIPVNGPTDVDVAVSDFANRVARIVRYTSSGASDVSRMSTEIAEAARRSFGFVNLTDLRTIVFPAELALSVGSLAVQSALRGLATLEFFGPVKMQPMLRDFFEMYTELPVFIGLEYKDIIRRCEDHLKSEPEDYKTRLELGGILGKCGLYEEADVQLMKIPKESPLYAAASHEASVSMGRAGKLERAAKLGVEAMCADPGNERCRYWLWLTAKRMGGYPDFVPLEYRMEARAGYAKPVVEFTDIAARMGLDKTSAGRGIAVIDYDNDGRLDIVISAAHGGVNLYHNNGDGTFTDVSINSGLDQLVNTFAIVAGDYNNDGFTDLFFTRLGFYAGDGVLMRNNGDGTFTDVTDQAGLRVWGPAFCAAWVDYDGDGFLDLFIANNIGGIFDRKTPNRLFHNNGDGTFTETTSQSGLKTIWPTIGCAWGDYDNDGRPDLFLSNGLGHSQLFHNNGDGTFTDVSEQAGVTASCFGSPVVWCDYDNDGWLDIVQFIWSDHEDVIHTIRYDEAPADGVPMRVYRNNRDGTFTEVGRELGLNGCWGTMSANVADFNNDGNLDIILGNGSPKMDRLDPMVIMESDGRKFRNTTFAAGLSYKGKSHGVNVADLFGDGRMSIMVASGGQYPGDLLTTSVYYPNRLAGNYINIRLVGVKSNRSAIGARVAIRAGGAWQHREVSGGSNFGCLPFEQHFGLAEVETIEAIKIQWPGGLNQTLEGPPINNTYEFTEGQPTAKQIYL